jgi:Arc/MetJ family transcription regulator
MRPGMRTNVVIDDALMEEAMRVGGFKTKRATIEEGLRLLVLLRKQKEIKRFRGKLNWEGDLDEMRSAT